MRGTDGANTVAPDNASITSILADTNELQTNQGNWNTATGFATPTNVSDAQTAIQTDISNLNNLSTSDIDARFTSYGLPTLTQITNAFNEIKGAGWTVTDTLEAIRDRGDGFWATATGFATPTDISNLQIDISNLNDFNPATDVVANVTLVDTVTTNTDMRGTDGANTVAPDNGSIASILVDTNELQLNQGNWNTATGFATPTNVSDAQTAIQTDISNLNDFNPSTDVVANVTLVDTVTTNTDMRGTDGANTVAPDNATLSSIDGRLPTIPAKEQSVKLAIALSA
jgi:hypothetical protein